MKSAKAQAMQPVAAACVESTTVEPNQAALRAALATAIEQLEGWVAWKCPKKYLREHQANIALLRATLAPEGSAESMVYPNVADIEVLIWYDTRDDYRPDADETVLIHGVVSGIVEGVYSYESRQWYCPITDRFFDDQIVAWARPRGVLL